MDTSPTIVAWLSRCSVEIEVALLRGKQAVLVPRRVDLLAEIDRTHSISAAARSLGISYRHAWLMVQEVNRSAGKVLVESAVGGTRGGGAQLTEHGLAALQLFNDLQTTIRAAAAQALPRALGATPEQSRCVHLLAAVSLQDAVGQLLADFTLLRPDIHIRSSFGSSNELADHVLSGLPADLFITASETHLERIAANGWIAVDGQRDIGGNGLALVCSGINLAAINELSRVKHEPMAIADPASPLGDYTRQWLQATGVDLDRLSTIVADNSRGVVSVLNSQRARMGIVFASDLSRLPSHHVVETCPAKSLAVKYVAAVLNRGQRQAEAEEFLAFVLGLAGQNRLRHCGILPVPQPNSHRSGQSRRRSKRAKD